MIAQEISGRRMRLFQGQLQALGQPSNNHWAMYTMRDMYGSPGLAEKAGSENGPSHGLVLLLSSSLKVLLKLAFPQQLEQFQYYY
jgi:hypothetical protein